MCSRCARENPDDARFCNACGAALVAEPRAREERKIVTAVFVDLVGSTARAERLDPEDVRAVLRRYHETLRRDLERYGGTVEKFIGDAVVAVYGAPTAHEDDPERAVRAALAARESIAALNDRGDALDLHVRVGVATGEALVTLDARAAEGESMVAGDVMNTAARIQAASAGGRHPRRRRDAPRDGAGDRVPGARARVGEGEDRPGRGVGGRRGHGPRLRPRGGRLVVAARRQGERARAAPRRVRPRARRALAAARDPRRRARDREEQARDRAPRGRGRGRGDHHLAVRPLPALRRRGHVLGARGDRQGTGGHPRERHRRARRGEARTRSSPTSSTKATDAGSSRACARSSGSSRRTSRSPTAARSCRQGGASSSRRWRSSGRSSS